jgi:CheY-like chemotaxis protein
MRKKLLLIEDNRADAVLVQLAIDDSGHDMTLEHLSDGEKMLAYLESQRPDEVSFILLDLNIPKANGEDILRAKWANADWKKVPVVVYSSSTRDEDIQSCLSLGANAYVCKQIDFDAFNLSLRSTINFWHTVALR